MRTMRFVACMWALVAGTLFAEGTETTLNYQGRIFVGAGDYNGDGYFKFRILNESGEGVWANDGSSGTNEPVACITNNLANGLFTVDLGDTYNGMAPLPATSLHHWQLWLRTWFSTNSAGPFECLSPDVNIRKLTFADLDTGSSVIVDSSGRGDFQDIQSAVDYAATNWNVWSTILVWPGYYEVSSPVALPTNRWLTLKGLGAAGDSVTVVNTNGAALLAGDGVVESMHFSGSPALSDQGSPDNYSLTVRRCSFEARGNGSAAIMQRKGYLTLDLCRLTGGQDPGAGIDIGDSAGMNVAHCEIGSTGNQPAMRVAGMPGIVMESCRFLADSQSPFSIRLEEVQGSCEFKSCRIDSGLYATNSPCRLILENCNLGAQSGLPGQSGCLRIEGGQTQARVIGGTMDASSNTVVTVLDATGYMTIMGAQLNGSDECAIKLLATEAAPSMEDGLRLSVANSRISVGSSGGVTNQDAVVVNNGCTTGGVYALALDLRATDVNGTMQDAISCVGGPYEIDVSNSPEINGKRNGITASGAGEVSVVSSDVSGTAGDGVNMTGEGMLWVRSSDVTGGEDGPGRGIYTSMNGVCVIVSSVVGSENGPAVEVDAGKLLCMQSFLNAKTNTIALLRSTNSVAEFTGCKLFSTAAIMGLGSTAPVVTLDGATGNTPVPKILASTLEAAPQAAQVIALTGGATTGLVVMAHSGLSTNMAPNIGIIPSPAIDAFGNYRLLNVP